MSFRFWPIADNAHFNRVPSSIGHDSTRAASGLQLKSMETATASDQ
jgi:hypothetical protein